MKDCATCGTGVSSWGLLQSVTSNLLPMMAGDQMSIAVIGQWRIGLPAELVGIGAARVKVAAAWRIDRRGNLPGQWCWSRLLGIWNWHRVKEGFCVGVLWGSIEFIRGRKFDNLAKIHDCNPVTDVLDNGEIVRNEQIAEIMLPLDFL